MKSLIRYILRGVNSVSMQTLSNLLSLPVSPSCLPVSIYTCQISIVNLLNIKNFNTADFQVSFINIFHCSVNENQMKEFGHRLKYEIE